MEQYVHKLLMHDGIMIMTICMGTLYNAYVSIEDVNKGSKTLSKGKTTYQL